MYFAEVLPPDGFVVTIEKFTEFADIARTNFQNNNLDSKIRLIVGDALSILQEKKLNLVFDLIFIDGNKECYSDFLELGMDILSETGVIVIDNVTFQGDVLNQQPTTAKGLGVLKCLEKIRSLSEWDSSFIPFNDGMIVLRRSNTTQK